MCLLPEYHSLPTGSHVFATEECQQDNEINAKEACGETEGAAEDDDSCECCVGSTAIHSWMCPFSCLGSPKEWGEAANSGVLGI